MNGGIWCRLIALWCVAAVAFVSTAQAEGRKYALLVGVGSYDPTQLSRLRYAETDMIALGRALEPLGFDVVVMTSQAPVPDQKPVTAQDIIGQVVRRVSNRSPEDTILVAFSGHGVQLRRETAGADGAKETYFCPERARLGDPATLLRMSDVVQKLASSKAGRKLLIVDACRDEVEPKDVQDKLGELELDPAGVTRRTMPEGMATFFSCSSKERSFEVGKLGHSAFTFHILQYLDGAADRTRYPKGDLSLAEMTTYVARQTRDYMETRIGVQQTPELVGKFNDWPLGNVKALPSGRAGTLHGHSAQPESLEFTDDGSELISCDNHGKIFVWDVENLRQLRVIRATDHWVNDIAVDSAHRWIVAACGLNGGIKKGIIDPVVRVFELDTGKERLEFKRHQSEVTRVSIAKDASIAVSGDASGVVFAWRTADGRVVRELDAGAYVTSTAVSRDGRRALIGLTDGDVVLWDIDRGRVEKRIKGTSAVHAVSFSEKETDALVFAIYGDFRRIKLSSGQIVRRFGFGKETDNVVFAAFSESHDRIVTGSIQSDKTCVWNMRSGELIDEYHTHKKGVWTAAFCPHSRLYATGSSDLTIHLSRLPLAE